MNDTSFKIKPVAYVRNSRPDPGDDYWGDILSEIVLADDIPAGAFEGIEQFSHLEIIFLFHKADPSRVVFSGHPRENKAWPHTGIFAQRKKDRPNHLGTTMVKLISHEGRKITVANLDAIDGTPVIDIKPVMHGFLPATEISQPAWASELMEKYWLKNK